jgi:serine/threonine protein kinase/WD40 repeat protein
MVEHSDSSRSPPEAYLEAFWADVENAAVRPLAEYQRQFRGHEAEIARAYRAAMGRLAESSARDEPGAAERIGPYRLISRIGRGAQGTVYLAEHVGLGRRVALKVLDPDRASDPVRLDRFRREAAITSKLDHPGICTVYESGEAFGTFWISMRYVEGVSLASKIESARLGPDSQSTTDFLVVGFESGSAPPVTEAPPDRPTSGPTSRAEIKSLLAFFEAAARALHAAHEAGVIHRDIKPGNIIVSKVGAPVIVDFGLAQEADGSGATITTNPIGTPAYMSPEQLMGQQIRLDRRTDLFSLGVTLYESLTLRRPFAAPTHEGLCQAIMTKDPPDPRKLNPALGRDLRIVLDTALEKDRDHRYQTGADLAEDLRRIQHHEPILAKPAGPILRLGRWTQRNPALALSLFGLFAALAVGLTVTLLALGGERLALRLSEAARLTSQSTVNLPKDPALALLLALKAEERSPSLAARNALLASLLQLTEQKTYYGIRDLSGSSDAGSIAMVTAGGRVILVDLAKGFAETEVQGLPGPASLAAMSPAGDRVVIAGRDGGAVVWVGGTVSQLVAPGDRVVGVLFSSDGKRILLQHESGRLCVRNATTFEIVDERMVKNLCGMASDAHATVTAVSRFGSEAEIVRADANEPIGVGDPGGLAGLQTFFTALSPEGDRVLAWNPAGASSGLSATTRWDPMPKFRPQQAVRSAAFSPTEQVLATGLCDGTVRLWDAIDGALLDGQFTERHNGNVTAIAFSPDGRCIVTGSADHDVRIWDTKARNALAVLRGHTQKVECVMTGRDARTVVSFGADSTVRVWSPHLTEMPHTPTSAEAHALLPAISPVAREAASGGDEDIPVTGPVEVAKVLGAAARDYLASAQEVGWWNSFKFRKAVFSPDGRWVAAVTKDGAHVCLRSTTPPDPGRILDIPGFSDENSSSITFLSFSPDSRTLAIRYGEFRFENHTPQGQRCLVGVQPGASPVWLKDPLHGRSLVRISRDGKLALGLGFFRGAFPRVFNAADGAEVATLHAPTEEIIAAAFAPDGQRVLGGDKKGGVYLWDLRHPDAPVATLRHSAGIIRSVAFNDAGSLAVSASDDGARVWTLEHGEEWLTIQSGHRVAAAIFSADQKQVITLEDDGATRGWPLSVAEEAFRRRPRDLTPDEVDRYATLPPDDRREYRAKWDARMLR